MMTKRSEQSVQFEEWLMVCMRTADVNNFGEAAKIFGVSRRTLHTWIKHPEKLKRYMLAGIMCILNVQNDSLEELCRAFGIE